MSSLTSLLQQSSEYQQLRQPDTVTAKTKVSFNKSNNQETALTKIDITIQTIRQHKLSTVNNDNNNFQQPDSSRRSTLTIVLISSSNNDQI